MFSKVAKRQPLKRSETNENTKSRNYACALFLLLQQLGQRQALGSKQHQKSNVKLCRNQSRRSGSFCRRHYLRVAIVEKLLYDASMHL